MPEPTPDSAPGWWRRRGSLLVAVALAVLFATVVVVLAASPSPAPDRVQDLAERIRCPVCSGVSVAESPSDTAIAMRRTVAEQVAAGRSDPEILAYFRARYGEWALADPPASGTTLLLWVLPGLAVAVGLAAVVVRVRRSADDEGPELDDEARARVEEALARRASRTTTTGADRGEDDP